MNHLPWIIHTAGLTILVGVGLSFLINLLYDKPTSDSFWGGVIIFGLLALGVRMLVF